MFVGRSRELMSLEAYYQGEQFQLVIIDGPCGVGKTSLIRAFAADKPLVYVDGSQPDAALALALAIRSEHASGLLAAPSQTRCDVVGDSPDWEALLSSIARLARRRVVLAIDGYDELCECDPAFEAAFESELENLARTPVFCILASERTGRINVFADGKNTSVVRARMNRQTLSRLPFAAVHLIGDRRGVDESLARYAMLGGMPGNYGNASTLHLDEGYFDVPAFMPAGESTPTVIQLLKTLAKCDDPVLGMTNEEIARAFDVSKTQVDSIMLDLKRAKVVARTRLRLYEDGTAIEKMCYRLADESMMAQLRGVSDSGEIDGAYDKSVFRDVAGDWLWHGERNGILPFEINQVVWWRHGERGAGRTDLLAVDDHYSHVFACLAWASPEPPMDEDVRQFVADVQALPFKKHRCSVFSRHPAPSQLRDALVDEEVIWSSPEEYVGHYKGCFGLR